ncbi:DUF4232 domain-containing protein [Corynebacterium sp. MSK039]|uniref:DUF4232 domain-containing protein n=1 Tax=Corynebacterium sp. MSK039 TaxID=3050193 RepID=UPI00254FF80A|nr:DUF4232 domain-containing protein [Corynebacterium sp. MSK039]MDK8790646.1 DUF4232 domain-containing protein [Corynebacterium sp. MSK039]
MIQSEPRSNAKSASQPGRRGTDPAIPAVSLGAATSSPAGTRASRWARRAAAGLGAAALALTAACSGGANNPEDAEPQSLSSQTDRESTANAESASAGLAAAGDERKRDGLCTTPDLKIDTDNMQGAAGSTLLDIVFTNTGDEECSLEGYPGVSLVTDNNGTQLGASADREESGESEKVTLQPGDRATASVRITKVGALDPEECSPKAADGIRVYPPEETRSAYIELKGLEGCTGKDKYMSVQPVRAAQ